MPTSASTSNCSYFPNAWRPEANGATTLAQLYAMIADGTWSAQVAAVRAVVDNETAFTEAKKGLPALTLSGTLVHRRVRTTAAEREWLPCGRLQIDLDNLDGRTPEEMREALFTLPFVEAAWIGPSGRTVKGVAVLPEGVPHLAAFMALDRELGEALWCANDRAVKNYDRLCFVSHDPGLLYSAAAADAPLGVTLEDIARASAASSAPIGVGQLGAITWGADVGARLMIQMAKFKADCRHNDMATWCANAIALGAPDQWVIDRAHEWFLGHGRDPQHHEIPNLISWAREMQTAGTLSLRGPQVHDLLSAPTDSFEMADTVAEWWGLSDSSEITTVMLDIDDEITAAVVSIPTWVDPATEYSLVDKEDHSGVNAFVISRRPHFRFAVRDGQHFMWDGKSGYTALSDAGFEGKLMIEMAPQVQKPSTIVATRKHLDALAGAGLCSVPVDLPTDHATFANGILPLREWQTDPRASMLPYSPDWFTTGVTGAKYDPAAECPVWLGFLQSVWGDAPDCVALLQEWFGWHLVTDTYLQNFVILVGPRGAGKGTILRALQRFVGKANYESCSLHDLDGDYALSKWAGKRAVIFPDENGLDDRKIVTPRATSRILQVTSFDDVNIQTKYKDASTAQLPARVTMASNIVPTFPDFAGAVARRMLPLQLMKSFVGAEDVTLDARLSLEQDGIAQWALEGLRRVLTAGKFSVSPKIVEVREAVMREASPVTQWLHECIQPSGDVITYVRRDHVWALYRNWARAQNIFLVSQPRLGTFVSRTFPVASEGPRIRDEQGMRVRTWAGMRLTDDGLKALKLISGADEFAVDAKPLTHTP